MYCRRHKLGLAGLARHAPPSSSPLVNRLTENYNAARSFGRGKFNFAPRQG